MPAADTSHTITVTFADGREVVWSDGCFSGDEKLVARAVIRCEAILCAPLGDSFVMANNYSPSGAVVAIVGSTDISGVEVCSPTPVVFGKSVLAATIGTWH